MGAGINIINSVGNQIGGAVGGQTVIKADRQGVVVGGAVSTGNLMGGNRIGTDEAGTAALDNGLDCVVINNSAAANTAGTATGGGGSVISGNQRHGDLQKRQPRRVSIRGNGQLGIDLVPRSGCQFRGAGRPSAARRPVRRPASSR